MLNLSARWVVPTFLFASLSAGGQVLAYESFEPTGRWALVNDWSGAFELALFDIAKSSDGFETKVIDARPSMGSLELKSFECDGSHVSLVFRARAGELRFEGSLKDAGNHAGELLGTVERGAYIDPARLVRVDAEELKPDRSPPFEGYRDKLEAIWKLKDLKQRAEAWAEMVHKSPGPGTNFELRRWLISATDAGVKESQLPATTPGLVCRRRAVRTEVRRRSSSGGASARCAVSRSLRMCRSKSPSRRART